MKIDLLSTDPNGINLSFEQEKTENLIVLHKLYWKWTCSTQIQIIIRADKKLKIDLFPTNPIEN